MIRVEAKPFRDYFARREQQLIPQTDVSVIDARRHLASPAVMAAAIAVVLFSFSFTNRTCLLLFLTELAGLLFLFLRTRALAYGLSVRRILPTQAIHELDAVEVVVEITNRSDYTASPIVIDDLFGPAKLSNVRFSLSSIAGRSMLRTKYSRTQTEEWVRTPSARCAFGFKTPSVFSSFALLTT